MSSYIMHICVSELVRRKLNLSEKFLYGSILPDILKTVDGNRDSTHFLEKFNIDGEIRELPVIENAIEKLNSNIEREIRQGYIAHLVEDLLWFNNWIPTYAKKNIKGELIYTKDNSIHTEAEFSLAMYTDYTLSSNYIIKKYGIDIENIKNSLFLNINSEKEKSIISDNLKYTREDMIDNTLFMKKESVDKYIFDAVNEVEKVIGKWIGE